ncbi:copper radical oxidase [Vararia minispora EC-137]|uniref:Copper radical oxidase n=1 Tax=Vararia minispora EC-137 TaxID=1314806 RepID=A0ACB8QSV9_9AGAM|nr:copper radical oxidase [Vararia minispora EC-137]
MLSLFHLLTLITLPLISSATESAWNGHVLPGSTNPSSFTPYYIPPGAKSYDSASPLVHFSGKWTDSYASRYVGHTLRSTTSKGSSIIFTFTGTGIEWFGNVDSRHGIADVYIDGKLVDHVDSYSPTAHYQQRIFWEFSLPRAKHTIKIIHSGKRSPESKGNIIDIDAFVVTLGTSPHQSVPLNQSAPVQNAATDFNAAAAAPAIALSGSHWTLSQQGTTGVHAMQLAIISSSHALIMDKVEHNPLTIDGHPAWGALYNLNTHDVTPLHVKSNSFCAGGTFLSNGTLINVGGNPVVEDRTSSADFGDVDGMQSVRILEPCDSGDAGGCDIYENQARIRLASPRWYNTVLRIADGSAMILGGSRKGGWMNNATTNNPTLEYFPPKNIHGRNGLPIESPFLVDTLSSNLFPIAFSLPDGRIFIAANNDAMIYDWRANSEQRLPALPNGVRVTYPMSGTALLLPLDPATGYIPEVLICGGSTLDDKTPSWEISSQAPASPQCARMLLSQDAIGAGWHVEQMPNPRIMPDAVLLPTGDVVIVNGGASGIAGYGNVKNQIGASNAANPVLTSVLYRPNAPAGSRFDGASMPSSPIPRLYHSVATLTPNGDVMIAGSNPNLDRSEVEYGTEYRVEWLRPPYMDAERPALDNVPELLGFGQTIEVGVHLPASVQPSDVKVSLMDLGYVTHAVHANSRLVYLQVSVSDDKQKLTITGPPSGDVYPPGPGWLYVVAGGVPSVGRKIIVGDGHGPPVDQGAIDNLLKNTDPDQDKKDKQDKQDDGSE